MPLPRTSPRTDRAPAGLPTRPSGPNANPYPAFLPLPRMTPGGPPDGTHYHPRAARPPGPSPSAESLGHGFE